MTGRNWNGGSGLSDGSSGKWLVHLRFSVLEGRYIDDVETLGVHHWIEEGDA